MTKVKVMHFSAVPAYLYIIDDEGSIWRRKAESTEWVQIGEVPEAPKK